MAALSRWLRLVWPEVVVGVVWLSLLVLTHTLFTDDDMWQHRAIDASYWAVFAGYVVAAMTATRRLGASPEVDD